MALSSPTISAPACASCVFGAASTSLISYSLEKIETVTVSLIPLITVYPDGKQVTHYETSTITETDYVHSTRASATTYSNISDITWQYANTYLTYPTTYVSYYDFEGASETGTQTCAATSDATFVALPAGLNTASFIYPLGPDSAQVPLALLEYLQDQPAVSSQLDGYSLTACAPLLPGGVLHTSMPASTSAPVFPTVPLLSSTQTPSSGSSSNSTASSTQLTSSGLSKSTILSAQSSSSSSTALPTSTSSASASSSSSAASSSLSSASASSSSSFISTPTASSINTPVPVSSGTTASSNYSTNASSLSIVHAPSTTPYYIHSSEHHSGHHSNTQTQAPGKPGHATTYATSFETTTSRPSTAQVITPSPINFSQSLSPGRPSNSPEYTPTQVNTLTTAYVFSTITGPPIYTTASGPGGGGKAPDNSEGPSLLTTPKIGGGGENPHSPTTTPFFAPHTSPGGGSQGGGGNSPGSPHTPGNKAPPGGEVSTKTTAATHPSNPGSGQHVTTPAQQQPQPQQPQPQPHTETQTHIVYHLPSTTVTANSAGGIVYNGHTLLPGQTLTLNNGGAGDGAPGIAGASKTLVALNGGSSSATQLVVGGKTYYPSAQTTTAVVDSSPPHVNEGGSSYEAVVTANGHTLTIFQAGNSMTVEDAGSSTVVAMTDLPVTFEGQTLSMASPSSPTGKGGAVIVNNGQSTATFSALASSPTFSMKQEVIAVYTAPSGEVFTAVQAGTSAMLLEDASSTMTVKDGATMTFAGVQVVVASGGSDVVFGGAGSGAAGKATTEKLSTRFVSVSVSATPSASSAAGDVDNGGRGSGGKHSGGGTGSTTGSSGAVRLGEGLRTAILGAAIVALIGGLVIGM